MASRVLVCNTPLHELETSVLVVLLTEDEATKPVLSKRTSYADAARMTWLEELLFDPRLKDDFQGKKGQTIMQYAPKDAPTPRIVFAGLGSANATIEDIATAVGKAVDTVGTLATSVAIGYRSSLSLKPSVVAGAITRAAILAHYSYTNYKSTAKPLVAWSELRLSLPEEKDLAEVHAEVQAMATIGNATNYARDLINARAEEGTPEYYANMAKELAAQYPNTMKVHVFDETQLAELKAGLIVGVGKGAKNPPRMVVLEYSGEADNSTTALGLVGKGITYDSGGMNIKGDPLGMHDDMGGAGAVLGAMKAIASLKIKKNIVAVMPFAENMIGPNGVRTGDILTAMNGKTVEIKNTDAEGRLVLADAVHYCATTYAPVAIIDIATLTGNVVEFLGDHMAGVFSRPSSLALKFTELAEAVGEPCFPCPGPRPEYEKSLKSDVADMANSMNKGSGPRKSGAAVAAVFISRFVPEAVRWIHLDIAGPATIGSAYGPWTCSGSTGFGVALMVAYARSL